MSASSDFCTLKHIEQLVEIREGRRIHIEISEPSVTDKGTLVFIHGVGGMTRIWKNQVEHFVSEGYRTVALDLVGHGLSPLTIQNCCCCNQNLPIYSYSSSLSICLLCPSRKSLKESCLFHDSVLDVQAVVDRYVVEYYREKGTLSSAFVLLVAHSYGAAMAICVSLNSLDVVNGLVLISGGAPIALSPDRGLFSLPPWSLTFLTPCLRKGFETAYADRTKPIDPAVFDNMKELTAEERTSGYQFNAYTLWAVMAGQIWPQGSPKFYRQVKIPTLLLSGTEDRLVTLDEEMETHFAIKISDLYRLPGSGHMCMIEDPDRVNRFIGDHIQKIRNMPHKPTIITTQPNISNPVDGYDVNNGTSGENFVTPYVSI